MITLDSTRIAVIGGAAVALLAGIYVVWGPSDRRKRKLNRSRVTCPGLVNMGNTCFLNAVLQALAPCYSVGQWLAMLVERKQSCIQYVATTMQNVIKVLNNDSVEFTEEYCPSDVIRTLQARGWVISSEEQDAHEMFHVLTETLNEETASFPRVVPLFDITSLKETTAMSCDEAKNRINTDLPVLSRRETEHPFRGLLASQLKCKRCGHKCSIKHDTFDSLSLSIPSRYTEPLTLDHLLKHFIMSESVDDVVCERCSVQTPDLDLHTTFIKKLTIGKLPRCLCIHIQRTVWLGDGVPMKRCDSVVFPELLNMSPYIYQKKETPALRPKTLELDLNMRGLIGGRNKPNGINNKMCEKLNSKSQGPCIGNGNTGSNTSPTMTIPYSGPVNMLKALNYHSHMTHNGLYSVHPSSDPDNRARRRHIQLLAKAYSAETPPAAALHNAYKLTAVIVHLGDISSGHFITYRRAPSVNGQRFPDQWLYTSDILVKPASLSEVLSADAYMLFYEKI